MVNPWKYHIRRQMEVPRTWVWLLDFPSYLAEWAGQGRAPDLVKNLRAQPILSWSEGCVPQLWLQVRFQLNHKNADVWALSQIN